MQLHPTRVMFKQSLQVQQISKKYYKHDNE